MKLLTPINLSKAIAFKTGFKIVVASFHIVVTTMYLVNMNIKSQSILCPNPPCKCKNTDLLHFEAD